MQIREFHTHSHLIGSLSDRDEIKLREIILQYIVVII